MIRLLASLPLLGTLVTSAGAETCDTTVERVTRATGATLKERINDVAYLDAGDGVIVTLVCADPASVGVRVKGDRPPPAFFDALGKAAHAATELGADAISDAARKAHAKASSSAGHSIVETEAWAVTCIRSAAADAGMMCALSDKRSRS